MARWYHSGLEGYCKSMAVLAGLPDDQSGWGNIGRDLFDDGRFDDTVKTSKTWTLSRFRGQGRGNRPVLFEKCWLGAHGIGREADAVDTCVHGILSETTDSIPLALYREDYVNFAMGVRTTVVSAVADGFGTERYHATDIARFTQSVDDALGDLGPNDLGAFERLMTMVVAALVYGPNHELARATRTGVTSLAGASATAQDTGFSGMADEGALRITQLFSADASYLGYSELFGNEKAVFLGRGSDLRRYLAKCEGDLSADLQEREAVFFPIANSHRSTSSEHGVIVQLGDTWYFRDFSTNGSVIENGGVHSSVHHDTVALRPGDRICLGFSEPVGNEEAAFQLATTLLASFNVNESNLL